MSDSATQDQQTPEQIRQAILEEVGDRMADQSPALGISRLSTLQFLRGQWGNMHQAISSDRRLQRYLNAKTAGVDEEEAKKLLDGGDDAMGDIVIARDIHVGAPGVASIGSSVIASDEQQQPDKPTPQESNAGTEKLSTLETVLRWGVPIAAGAAIAGGALLLNDDPPSTNPQDWSLGVRVSEEPEP